MPRPPFAAFALRLGAGLVLAVGAPTLVGCSEDLGPCDAEAARRPFFSIAGLPAYEGQALMQVSCGNGVFCHASTAQGDERLGVPAGLDYDVQIACITSAACEEQVDRLDRAQQSVFDSRGDILAEVESGHMPPGEVGRRIRARLDYVSEDGQALPSIASRLGTEALRNWLACGSPVVERTEPHPSGRTTVGDVIEARGGPVSPTFQSIYARIFVPQCVACHSDAFPEFLDESQLDLSTAEVAFEALVGVVATGDDCADSDTVRVVPGQPDASLLVQKIEDPTDDSSVCGEAMPVGTRGLDPSLVVAIRQWIEQGALND